MSKIIVITPVKNEAWILDRFLSVTSQFADLIVIADQNSTDGCLDIYPKYPKVHLVINNNNNFNEGDRQLLLLETARRLMPDDKRIILALDADEIMAANSITVVGWQTMLDAKPGTVLHFENPDLYITPVQALRRNRLWPLGYVDDGAQHYPSKIHSIRLPRPSYADYLYLHDVKIMHYSLTRMDAQRAKMPFYTMTENVLKHSHFLARRYKCRLNYDYVRTNTLEPTPQEWFTGWEELGIDMKTIRSANSFWYDEEALRLFSVHGYKKFWLDNIWYKNWPELAKQFNITTPINKPPKILRAILNLLDKIYFVWKKRK
jgi:glycosyltransferase involved in cell wall biosynthesis